LYLEFEYLSRIKKIETNNVKEIILALSTTMEGQTTSFVIADKLEKFKDLNVTRLAQGIPMGGEVHYLDENTLNTAFQSRKKITKIKMDKLLYVPNPLLRQKANKIQSVGIKEKEIAKKMMQIMIKAPGVGLAANQIGILKQIVTIFFVDQETKKETQYTLFNPNIVSYSQEKIIMEEGCLSLPEQFADIERPQNIVVEYLDENNKQITKEVSGVESRILQHEIDEKKLKLFLLPKDEADKKNAIIEIRAGTGGLEASLFASDLFKMYEKVSHKKKWNIELISISRSEAGGLKEVIASIKGNNIYSTLKYESGVHRVQRVPDTETQGRVHTSAATVAVLPEAEEVDLKINDSDLRIDVFRAGGPGGQSVNTTDSAVRITHVPTGISVSQQDEKSQHKNKAKGMKILRARLYELERSRIDQERSKDRKTKIGTGDRSERIRTYNFPQGRVTDHRINLTLHKLDEFLEGEAFDEMIESLTLQAQEESLSNLK